MARNLKLSSSKFPETRAKEKADGKVSKDRELVKYMSKLPGYLERGQTSQDRVLSVGVLDWESLEKWRHGHNKQMSNESTHPSVSGTKTPAQLPIDTPTAGYKTSQVHPSAHRRTTHKSLQFHLMSNHAEDRSQVGKTLQLVDMKIQEQNPAAVMAEDHGKKDVDVNLCVNGGTPSNELNLAAASGIETRFKTQDDELTKKEKKLDKRNLNVHAKRARKKQSEPSQFSDSTMMSAQRNTTTRLQRCVEKRKQGCFVDIDGCGHLGFKSKSSFTDADRIKLPLEESQFLRGSTSSVNHVKDKVLDSRSAKGSADVPPKELDQESSKQGSENSRSISPFRRLSFSLTKTNKITSERDGVTLPQSDFEKAAPSISVDNSEIEKPSAKDRGRSSPLRRLIEPLMKPRVAHSSNSLNRSTIQQAKNCSSVQSEGVKPVIKSCVTVNVNDLAQEKIQGSSNLQALLRVTVKNNQPLFTFAVDNESDILAATMKKLGTAEEDDYTGLYTFFSIQELKKKKNSVWINQKSRCQGRDIISNVIGQMRMVSSLLPSGFIQEFVVFSVDYGKTEQEKSDSQINNELAAIVVKIPNSTNKTSFRDVLLCNGSEEENCSVLSGQSEISSTVILPGGVHSLPHKGGPSSLIQRWKTGGSCDCGGWDMACNLKVFANRYQQSGKNSTSSDSFPLTASNQFELFLLEGQLNNQPYFSFVPVKEGIYSVEYNSSISILQAFSICIAVAESKEFSKPSERRAKTFEETGFVQSRGVRYVSYPPDSPVSRV